MELRSRGEGSYRFAEARLMQVVWFKRDLRVQDHQPLYRAAQQGSVLPLYVVEPEYWRLPDTSFRQFVFLRQCLEELADTLAKLQCPLVVQTGDVVEIMATLHRLHNIHCLWSHEETGNLWTYKRDQRVAAWCRAQGVLWQQFPQHGVIRKIRSRRGWSSRWDAQMRSPVYPTPTPLKRCAISPAIGLSVAALSAPVQLQTKFPVNAGEQAGGRTAAIALLDTFLNARGEKYQKEMSSLLLAKDSCSRLSVHLAMGCLSIREVFQAVEERQRKLSAMPAGQGGMWGKSLHSYAGRLHWHCHFIQKLEDQPQHEVDHVHPGFAGLREGEYNHSHYDAWINGQTGFPFVDACVRYLNQTGWLNFRMRAMLMSFAAYHLWLHWREPGLYLARAFTDYEPGIHWNQVQMQSGTTGINTVRIYNPVKQSKDQDPEGLFIRRWVPELSNVPDAFIHEPWTMEESVQRSVGCLLGKKYPQRLTDHMAASKHARERNYAVRNGEGFRKLANTIQEKHGSRKSGIKAPAQRKKKTSRQLPLDL